MTNDDPRVIAACEAFLGNDYGLLALMNHEHGTLEVNDANLREAMKAALAAVDAAAWRPIEEAPKDETPIVRWHKRQHGPIAVRWGGERYPGLWTHAAKLYHFEERDFAPYFQLVADMAPPLPQKEGE